VLSGRIHPEIIGKKQKNSRPEYCFRVSDISYVFLQDPVAGMINLGSEGFGFYRKEFFVFSVIFVLKKVLMKQSNKWRK